MKCFILATCRNEELLPYTTLVFKTIHVGFPDTEVFVTGNELTATALEKTEAAALGASCKFTNLPKQTHQKWIQKLIAEQKEPFWICDTDMVFYQSVEDWEFTAALAGYRVPEFYDEFTKMVTRSRLHTSLMRIDPFAMRVACSKYWLAHRTTEFNPFLEMWDPIVVPLNGRSYFYDTMAVAYHALGGQEFTDEQKNAYFHFHFGSFSDLVLPALSAGEGMKAARNIILEDPSQGIGMWRAQDEYFEKSQLFTDGVDVIAQPTPGELASAAKFNATLCKGDQEAMSFCDIWYRYCHGIDDLIDTMQDGRPRMSKDQMVSLFFTAALLYNSSFYVRHRDILAPIILQITNTYRDSIAWEKSSDLQLRKMGDVFRTCGNEMYVMIALVLGGEAHMRQMSLLIKERDFALQHDKEGHPL